MIWTRNSGPVQFSFEPEKAVDLAEKGINKVIDSV